MAEASALQVTAARAARSGTAEAERAMTLGRLERRHRLYGPHCTPTGRSAREVRARVRTGVLMRNTSDAFAISAQARERRRALRQASKARDAYYRARRKGGNSADAESSEAGMCPGHPNIHHDSARCPTTGSSRGLGSSRGPGPPRATDLPPAGRENELVKEQRSAGNRTCDESWCNCESVEAGAAADVLEQRRRRLRSCRARDEQEGCDLCAQRYRFVLSEPYP